MANECLHIYLRMYVYIYTDVHTYICIYIATYLFTRFILVSKTLNANILVYFMLIFTLCFSTLLFYFFVHSASYTSSLHCSRTTADVYLFFNTQKILCSHWHFVFMSSTLLWIIQTETLVHKSSNRNSSKSIKYLGSRKINKQFLLFYPALQFSRTTTTIITWHKTL